MYKNKWLACILLTVPFVAFVGVFLLYPAGVNIYNSFFKFANRLDQHPTFVGFDNYMKVFKEQNFVRSLLNTGLLMLCVVVFQIGIALLLAMLVSSLKKGATVFRIIFFMPIVVSATAIGLLYLMFIQPNGLFTQISGGENINWLPAGKPRALLIVMTPVVWQYIGFYFVIFLTGLSGISEDVYEAAKIDGAGRLRTVFRITLPMLQNVIRTCVILAITGALKVFDLPHIIAKDGAPGYETIFMGTYNNWLYSRGRVGESAVYSLLIVVVGIAVSVATKFALKENKDI
ncbi:MAG: sugar ABC transporter permease [Firmicutes bacterium]|nr:sugar ABC transporter permease [Bacillota bacterium]